MTSANPFPLPSILTPALQRVFSYWDGLKRAGNKIPFSDDVNLSALPDLSEHLLLIDVFQGPERFRFNFLGRGFVERPTGAVQDGFLDEVTLKGSLVYFRSQCSATIEASAPTYFQFTPGETGFARILLPMWGDGRVSMLLGAVDAN